MFMHDSLMADSASESNFYSDILRLRHISSSLFSISGFFVGFSTKVSPNSESKRSPKSPLDFGVFSKFRYSVNLPPTRSLPQSAHEKKWYCSKVGLGIFNSLDDDTTSEILDFPKRKNIVFGPQIKTSISHSSRLDYCILDYSLKSKFLPRNYIVSHHYRTARNKGGVPFEPEQFVTRPPSLVSLTQNHELNFNNCSQAKSAGKPPLTTNTGLEVENCLGMKPYSLPIPICFAQGNAGSISQREIELSEDYTCIISHGPNPKTIHIFGDCALECQTNELNCFVKKEVA